MNRLKYSACVVLVAGSAVALGAQAGTADKPADAKTPMPAIAAASASVTLTGCLAKASGGTFRLTNVQPAPVVAQPTGTTGAPTLDAPASMDRPTSYALTGANLKAHVGHKVEVTGTESPSHAPDATKATSAPVIGATPTIDVTSVKMLASTCS